jgi:hypothetical protein
MNLPSARRKAPAPSWLPKYSNISLLISAPMASGSDTSASSISYMQSPLSRMGVLLGHSRCSKSGKSESRTQ